MRIKIYSKWFYEKIKYDKNIWKICINMHLVKLEKKVFIVIYAIVFSIFNVWKNIFFHSTFFSISKHEWYENFLEIFQRVFFYCSHCFPFLPMASLSTVVMRDYWKCWLRLMKILNFLIVQFYCKWILTANNELFFQF